MRNKAWLVTAFNRLRCKKSTRHTQIELTQTSVWQQWCACDVWKYVSRYSILRRMCLKRELWNHCEHWNVRLCFKFPDNYSMAWMCFTTEIQTPHLHRSTSQEHPKVTHGKGACISLVDLKRFPSSSSNAIQKKNVWDIWSFHPLYQNHH